MTFNRLFFSALALLAFWSGARAQFVWDLSLLSREWRYEHSFKQLSCSGNNCTVAAITKDLLKGGIYKPLFFHSIDGGETWSIQDPQLPWFIFTPQRDNNFTRLQQIDSLNVIAIGDSSFIVRTFDGGMTWETQNINTMALLTGVHFSDPATGIIVGKTPAGTGIILTTVNGGREWKQKEFVGESLLNCHSYGNGKFRASVYSSSLVYTTFDDWKTSMKSTSPVDSTIDPLWNSYYFFDCNFSGDTIITYGTKQLPYNHAAIVRSIDGGIHWERPFTDTIPGFSVVLQMTHFDRDTILAAGQDGQLYKSIDKGKTWIRDTFEYNLFGVNTPVASSIGINWTSNNLLAIIRPTQIPGGPYYDRIVIKGASLKSLVPKNINPILTPVIFPNPAEGEITIRGILPMKEVRVFNIIGKEVFRGESSTNGEIVFNVHSLSEGVYSVLVDDDKIMRPTGRFIVKRGNK